MAVGDRYVNEVDYYHKYQEDDDIEDYHIDIE